MRERELSVALVLRFISTVSFVISGVLPIPDLDNKAELHEAPKSHPKEEQKLPIDETLNKPQNNEIDESENRANEEHDNDIDIEEKNQRNQLDDALNPDKNIVNNAAEEFDAHKPGESKKIRNDEMDLEIINRPNGPKDKLNDEIAGDHGKESDGYPEMEDLHMIEGAQEEADDLGDGESELVLNNFETNLHIFFSRRVR